MMEEKTDSNRRTLRTMVQTTIIDVLQSGVFLIVLYYALNYVVVWKFENQEDENPFTQPAKQYVTFFIAALVIYKIAHFVETNIPNYFPDDKYRLYKQFTDLTFDFAIAYILTKYIVLPLILQVFMKNNESFSLETIKDNVFSLSLIQFGGIGFSVLLWLSSIMILCFKSITAINEKILSKRSKDAWAFFEHAKRYLLLVVPMVFLLEYALLITLHQKVPKGENDTNNVIVEEEDEDVEEEDEDVEEKDEDAEDEDEDEDVEEEQSRTKIQ